MADPAHNTTLKHRKESDSANLRLRLHKNWAKTPSNYRSAGRPYALKYKAEDKQGIAFLEAEHMGLNRLL
jgi:hypothetical protein